ncbi:hypothetical protein HCH_06022 [Hahella chejuensis KCTC 2396]|uniref:Uncharacterized protein n=1 Tax=Hahella chejuensis (strain KCTC 2396) TaxID=349521 RepID=Q2S9K2_HAHCH|nr:hypothetical protein HCH_06022 [Hahella chejuensis KCTC 2396]
MKALTGFQGLLLPYEKHHRASAPHKTENQEPAH